MLKKIVIGAFVVVLTSGMALAQGIKRTPLQDVKFPAGYHIVTVIAEIGPSQLAGLVNTWSHLTHPSRSRPHSRRVTRTR